MKIRFLYLFFLIVVISSCGEEPYEVYKVREYKTVNGEQIKINGLDSLYATDICLKNSFLILQTKTSDKAFHIVDLNTWEHIVSFGDHEGPDALKSPRCYCQFLEENDSLKIIIRELSGEVLNLVNIDAIVENNEFVREQFELPYIYLPKTVFITEDKKGMIGGGGVDGIVFNFSIEDNRIHWGNVKPQIQRKYNRETTDFIYTAISDVNEEKKQIAIAYILFNRIDLFDYDGRHIRTIHYNNKKNIEPLIEGDFPSSANLEYYFGDIDYYGEKIYVLYSGYNLEEIEEKDYTYLHILDDQGNLRKALKLNHHIRKFAISANGQKIYALTNEDNGESNIIRIDI